MSELQIFPQNEDQGNKLAAQSNNITINYEKYGQYEAEVLGLRSERSWGRRGRDVIDRKITAGIVETKINDELRNWSVYDEANTRTMTPEKHRLFLFIEKFYKYADKKTYCTEASRKMREQGQQWTCHTPFRMFHRNLTHREFQTHFGRKGKFIGIICPKGWTEWLRFDIDNHSCKDNGLFFQRVAVAYDWFVANYPDQFLSEIRYPDPSGCHFDLLFEKPISLSAVKSLIAGILHELDRQSPELRWHECKEVRPSATENTRLPLGKGYRVLLDHPVDCTIHEFLVWWQSPVYIPDIRKELRELYNNPLFSGSIHLRGTFNNDLIDPEQSITTPKPQLFNFNNDFTDIEQPKPKPDTFNNGRIEFEQIKPIPKISNDAPKAEVKFHRNYWKTLTSYWSGESILPGIYNKILLATARIAFHQGYEQESIIQTLEEYSRELPPESCSDIASGNWSKLNRRIVKAVKCAAGDGHQDDPDESGRKLRITAQRWLAQGSLILDKSTWGKQVGYDLSDEDLPEDYREQIIASFSPLVPKRFHAHIPAIAVRMAKLALAKHREGNGISYSYWSGFIKDQFKIGSFAKKGLLSRLLTSAKELGIIKETGKHIKGIKGTTYTMGSRMARVLGQEISYHGPAPTSDDYAAVEALWED